MDSSIQNKSSGSGPGVYGENDDISFSTLLKMLRTQAKLSQGDVAKIMGYATPQFVSNWERGISDPPVEKITKIAEIYGVTPEFLLEKYIQLRLRELEKSIREKYKLSVLAIEAGPKSHQKN